MKVFTIVKIKNIFSCYNSRSDLFKNIYLKLNFTIPYDLFIIIYLIKSKIRKNKIKGLPIIKFCHEHFIYLYIHTDTNKKIKEILIFIC